MTMEAWLVVAQFLAYWMLGYCLGGTAHFMSQRNGAAVALSLLNVSAAALLAWIVFSVRTAL